MYQFENFLIRNAQMYPDRLAFVYREQHYTWRELNCAVNRLAHSFAKLGIGRGDRVAYMFPNCAETVLVFLATQKLGATGMPINTHFLSGEISRIMDVVDCKAAVYDAKFSDTIHEAQKLYGRLSYMIVKGEPKADEIDLSALLNGDDDSEAQVDLTADDESVIILTSGTTGTSKAVLRTQSMMREYGLMLAIENDNSHKPEVALTHCPFFHTACLSILVKMLALCGTFVLVDRVEPEFIFEQIEKYGVTMMLMVPPLLYMRLYDSGIWKQRDTSTLREAQFTGGKRIIVTPGMIELGSEQENLNREFGRYVGEHVDVAIVVGEYNRDAIVGGIKETDFPEENLHIVDSFNEAQQTLSSILKQGDTVLYENDLPDTFK